MSNKKSDKIKAPVVRIDASLEKYKGKILFKEKLEKTNQMLKTIGLPKTAGK